MHTSSVDTEEEREGRKEEEEGEDERKERMRGRSARRHDLGRRERKEHVPADGIQMEVSVTFVWYLRYSARRVKSTPGSPSPELLQVPSTLLPHLHTVEPASMITSAYPDTSRA
ncbi:unnamed protein product [Pleuronectes platessa]|uniref:Uncharacterized protein n=1 Tax=Pleuronectes platessa TaxID=8262 RepID=A0A9N7UL61_PLEPL|nr:unnamed protein product [Pleuronectes platessa]